MKKTVLSGWFLIFLFTAAAQPFAFRTDRPALKDLAVIEKEQGGQAVSYGENIRFTVSNDYFPGAGTYNLANPLTWTRKTPFSMRVQYYYSLPDSMVRLAEYTLNNADTVLLKKVFDSNLQQLLKLPGKLVADNTEGHNNWYQRTITWESETAWVKQFMVIGSYTYRVRVLVSWK